MFPFILLAEAASVSTMRSRSKHGFVSEEYRCATDWVKTDTSSVNLEVQVCVSEVPW